MIDKDTASENSAKISDGELILRRKRKTADRVCVYRDRKKALGIDLNNCIIIFDEAHNIERICEDAASIEITSTDIAMAIQELTHLMKYMDDTHNDMIVEDDSPKAFTFDDLITMKSLLLEFEKAVDEIPVKFDGDTYEASYINQLLSKAGINALELSQLAITSDRVFQYLSSTRQEILNRSGVYIERLRNLFSKVNEHSTDPDKVNKCFKVHIREVTVSKGGKAAPGSGGWQSKFDTKKQKIISYWCFSPSFGIDILLRNGVRNIILTSGTLAPLNPLIAELGIDVKCRLENPHIVSKDQVLIKIVKNGFQNVLLDSSFKNRDNPSYIQSLGKTIQAFAGMIPGGLLVFFPSYPILNQCVEAWKQDSSWLAINKRKPIFIEPRDKTSFVNVMSQYYEQIKASDSTGACFFAVCRGKVSEGLDFADLNGRGVIITGLPFPPLKDPKVVIKRKYLDENLNRTLNGSQWYTLEATKAVNQAIGRVIRHRNDYGAILLCDHRFDSPNLRNDLSSWVRNLIEVTNTFPGAISGVAKFFHLAQAKYSNSISTPTVPAIIKSEPLPQSQQHLYSIEENVASSSKKIESIMSEYKSEHVPANSKSKFNLFNVSHNENSGFQFRSSDISENSSGLVKINDNPRKKRKINIVANTSTENEQKNLKSTMESLIQKLKEKLTIDKNKLLIKAILDYKSSRNIYNFIKQLHEVLEFVTDSEHYLRDISEFISSCDKSEFFKYIALRTKWDNLSLDARKNDSYKNYCLCK